LTISAAQQAKAQLHLPSWCVPAGAFEEALRGAYAEGDVYKETITWPKIKVLLRIPSNWLIIFQVGTDVLHHRCQSHLAYHTQGAPCNQSAMIQM
jgi:hypothetical protein